MSVHTIYQILMTIHGQLRIYHNIKNYTLYMLETTYLNKYKISTVM